MPSTYAELEVGLHRRYSGGFTVELRLSQPDSEAEDLLASGSLVTFDLDALHAAELDPACYGKLLAQSLFADPAVREKFAIAANLDTPLRLRLFVGPSAPELHELRWETLRHPGNDSPLVTGDRLLFSRYLSSSDWRRVRLRPKSDMRALVAIANPTQGVGSGPGEWPLDPIDVTGEQKRANDALGSGMPATTLAAPVTLDALVAQLRAEPPDLLYLACHGARPQGGEPVIFLEEEDGKVAPVPVGKCVEQLLTLEQLPRLVVLASCRSAGGDNLATGDGALAAFGPRLAEAGIPAVVAMQGNVTMRTIERFMPAFFTELRDHGQIDQAMARARNAVRDEPDAWMPVLFLRLSKGAIWYVPGFAGEETDFEQWPSLVSSITEGNCTPILGPSLLDEVFGARRETARRWAESYHFPLAPQDREDLPQVAQYLTVKHDPMFPLAELRKQIRDKLLSHYRGEPPPELAKASLNEIATAVGKQQREANPSEPHRVLASLPLPIYITTNPDNLLADALREAGKDPKVELFRWNDYARWPSSIFDDRNQTYQPTVQQPLVYHLFGNLDHDGTLVLTEDNYFDYLIGATTNKKNIPTPVTSALTDHALLFVGFQMDDWDFRVLFRSIVSRQGRMYQQMYYRSVGVQVAPEEGRFLASDAARKYLDTYFGTDKISLYWGSAEDFTRELGSNLQPAGAQQGGT
jgi:CHAT domain/SIR2-like domain